MPTVGWETFLGHETYVHKITNVPVFLYGAGHSDFVAGKSITRAILKGVGPENLPFLGPKGT
jgi:hypothetical protein